MSEENEVIDNEQENEGEDGGEGAGETQERDWEGEASKIGWLPPEKLKDPSKGVDAKTFVERGETILPIVNAKYKAAEAKNAEYERKLAEQDRAIERANKMGERLTENAMRAALEALKAEQLAAAASGDEKRYNELDKRRDNIAKEFEIEPVKQPSNPQVIHPAVSKFEQENASWYGQDMILTKNANDLDAALIASGKFTSVEARHAEVKRQIVEAFPHKFTNSKREVKTGLGAGRNPQKPSSTKRGWDAMPEADRKAAAGFIKGGMSKDDYAKGYFEMLKEGE